MRLYYQKPLIVFALILVITFYKYLAPKSSDTSNEIQKHTEELLKNANKMLETYYDVIKSLRRELEVKSKKHLDYSELSESGLGDTYIRDFYHYKCNNIVRYGKESEDLLIRSDGSYYVCNDGNLKLKHSNCLVMSFGIYNNDDFDYDINTKKNCVVHSFDPFNEPSRVQNLRSSHGLNDEITIEINPRWFFHSVGITNGERIKNVDKRGGLNSYENILKHLNLTEKIVDVFKIDTEGAEWESIPFIMDTNPDLLCKRVKQLAIETHSWLYNHTHNYRIIQRLEKCFRLFKRDQRFYITMQETEWQTPGFTLPLENFKNEVDLARFLFLYGELYFVNINFLK